MRILRDREYLGWVLSGGLVFAGLLAYISGSSFVFIELFHVPPERFGLYFGANAIGLMIASQVNRCLAARVRPEVIVRMVLPIAVIAGVTLLVDAYTGFGGFPGILVPLFCFIACHGFVAPNTTALAMSPYGAVAGSASALMGTLQFVLGAAAGGLVSAFGNGTAVPFAAVDCRLRHHGVRRAPDAANARGRLTPAGRRYRRGSRLVTSFVVITRTSVG